MMNRALKTPVIVAVARTPIGSFGGALASLSAADLGAAAIKGAVDKLPTPPTIDEAYLGNVVSAGVGQAPARQAVIKAGLPQAVPCNTINRVCSSGLKSIQLAAQSIMIGQNETVLAGGFESMSNTPYYLPKVRFGGLGYGHGECLDGIIKDALWDSFTDQHMGNCAEVCAEEMKISREEQDAFALESYRRAKEAHEEGRFKDEVVPVHIKQRRGDDKVIDTDEEIFKLKADKVPSLRPAFKKAENGGTVTAANASSLNDGAAAVIVMEEEKAKEMGYKPLAKILGFADAAQAPVDFTTAPALAIPMALKNANVSKDDVDFYEINEAFSVVSLANNKLLDLDPESVNMNGGAVALGHPVGMSGARIITSLCSVLHQQGEKKSIGVAAICNGGGGASAMVLERMD